MKNIQDYITEFASSVVHEDDLVKQGIWLTTTLTQLQKDTREEFVGDLEVYIKNCDKALEEGAGSQFGSASGAIQLSGCRDALKDLQEHYKDKE